MRTLGREGAFGAGAYALGEQLHEGDVIPAEIAKIIVLGYAGCAVLGLGGNLVGRSARYLRKGATTAGKRLKEVVRKPATTITRETAEATAPKLNVGEKVIELT